MDHAECAAADHDVGVAAAEDFGGFANRLRARGACREAIQRRPPRAGEQREVRQRHIRLLLKLADNIHLLKRELRPLHHVELVVGFFPRRQTRGGERVEVQRPFAGAEINSNAIQIEIRGRQSRGFPCLIARGQRKRRVAPDARMVFQITHMLREVKILHFGADLRRKRIGVEDAGLGNAGFTGEQARPDRLDVVTHRGDPADSSDDDALLTHADFRCLLINLRTLGKQFKRNLDPTRWLIHKFVILVFH